MQTEEEPIERILDINEVLTSLNEKYQESIKMCSSKKKKLLEYYTGRAEAFGEAMKIIADLTGINIIEDDSES